MWCKYNTPSLSLLGILNEVINFKCLVFSTRKERMSEVYSRMPTSLEFTWIIVSFIEILFKSHYWNKSFNVYGKSSMLWTAIRSIKVVIVFPTDGL